MDRINHIFEHAHRNYFANIAERDRIANRAGLYSKIKTGSLVASVSTTIVIGFVGFNAMILNGLEKAIFGGRTISLRRLLVVPSIVPAGFLFSWYTFRGRVITLQYDIDTCNQKAVVWNQLSDRAEMLKELLEEEPNSPALSRYIGTLEQKFEKTEILLSEASQINQ